MSSVDLCRWWWCLLGFGLRGGSSIQRSTNGQQHIKCCWIQREKLVIERRKLRSSAVFYARSCLVMGWEEPCALPPELVSDVNNVAKWRSTCSNTVRCDLYLDALTAMVPSFHLNNRLRIARKDESKQQIITRSLEAPPSFACIEPPMFDPGQPWKPSNLQVEVRTAKSAIRHRVLTAK
jgi:hypothetical protein